MGQIFYFRWKNVTCLNTNTKGNFLMNSQAFLVCARKRCVQAKSAMTHQLVQYLQFMTLQTKAIWLHDTFHNNITCVAFEYSLLNQKVTSLLQNAQRELRSLH
jgi:ABC-type branched-subunit amino acid transport system ATPase component